LAGPRALSPVAAALADAIVFVTLCVALTGPLGLPGIGLAASAAAAVNVIVLVVALRRREGRLHGRAMASSFGRIALAATVMGAFLAAFLKWVPEQRIAGWPGAGILAATIVAATVLYGFAAHLLGAPEPAELRQVARKRRQ